MDRTEYIIQFLNARERARRPIPPVYPTGPNKAGEGGEGYDPTSLPAASQDTEGRQS